MKRVICSLLATSLLVAVPASAQDNVGKRVERLEKEMRAVQRKVFQGDSTFFEPDIKPEATDGNKPAATTSAVTDLIARVDALERSMQTLTGKVEQNEFRLKKLEDAMASGSPPTATETSSTPTPPASSTNSAAQTTSRKRLRIPNVFLVWHQ